MVVDDERDATIVVGTWPATTCESAPAASLLAAGDQASSPCFRDVRSGGRQQMLANWSSVFEDISDIASELVAASIDAEAESRDRTGGITEQRRITVCQPRVSQY